MILADGGKRIAVLKHGDRESIVVDAEERNYTESEDEILVRTEESYYVLKLSTMRRVKSKDLIRWSIEDVIWPVDLYVVRKKLGIRVRDEYWSP